MIASAANEMPWFLPWCIPFLVLGGMALMSACLGGGNCVRQARRRRDRED